MNRTEEALRRVLTTEAGDTAPGLEALDQVRAAAQVRAGRRHRNGLVMWAMAVAASVIGFVVIFINADRTQDLDVGPATTVEGRPGAVPVHPIAAVTGTGALVLVDPDTGHPIRTLASGAAPDVAVSAVHAYYSDAGDGNASLWRVPLVGGEPERLATGHSPAISADGRTLAYVAKVDPGALSESIVIRDLLTGTEETLTWAPGEQDFFLTNGLLSDLAWSPDRRRLAFVSSYEGAEIRVIRLDSADTLSDSSGLAGGTAPAWLDDATVVYVHECCFGDVPREPRELKRVALGGTPELFASGEFRSVAVNDAGQVLAVTDQGITIIGRDDLPGDYAVADW